MKLKTFIFILFAGANFLACTPKTTISTNNSSTTTDSGGADPLNTILTEEVNVPVGQSTTPSLDQPKTIRDFFMLLPEKYFVLEGCAHEKDRDCRKAKADYLKTFTEVEDIANGYFKGGCDGAQSCLEMAIFKRPDASYLVAVATSTEMMNDYYFLDYADGKWRDVSSNVVPQFSKKNMYELPRQGTDIKVFAKKVIEKGNDYEVTDKGEKLYDLEWKNGKFAIRK
ncbi:MAG: hypothetical protein ABIU09_13215 [Pyrinomonadaceae bacterium]